VIAPVASMAAREDQHSPDLWDTAGAGLCLLGAMLILTGSH